MNIRFSGMVKVARIGFLRLRLPGAVFLRSGCHKGPPEPGVDYRYVCYTAASNEAVQGLNITGMSTTGM